MSNDDLKQLLLDIDAAFDGGGDYSPAPSYAATCAREHRIPALKAVGDHGIGLRLRILRAAEKLRAAG